jgi:hypothetical protein
VKAVTPNESAEIYARTIYGSTANWGSSCISNGADWDVDATNENGLWPYRKTLTEKGGENTIVFLIDEGGIDIFDFVSHFLKSRRITRHLYLTKTFSLMVAERYKPHRERRQNSARRFE